MTRSEEFVVSIPSDTAEGQAVQERIIGMLEQMEFPARDVFGVRLALEEAIVNAIKHGNRMDPSKQVEISCRCDEKRVNVEIQDEGEGFNLRDVPDPTEEENLERPCGRGIMLMNAFLSKVSYNDAGNRVILEKIRSDAENVEAAPDETQEADEDSR